MNTEHIEKANRRLLGRLVLVVIGMFGFGYAMVPLYNVLCDVTGLNGKTGTLSAEQAEQMVEDKNRTITVEFVANLNQNMELEFKPNVHKMQVHPGKLYSTSFFAKNLTAQRMVGQAIPSVAPNEAAPHFSKTECFCFTNQSFKGGEGRNMPLRFIVNPRLPKDIKTISLAYTFFDITQTAMQ